MHLRPFIVPLLVLVPAVARPQVGSAPAKEVRITTRAGRTYYGQLDAVSADTVRIRVPGVDGPLLAGIPRDSIARYEVNHPGGRHTVIGGLLGVGAGYLVGASLALSNCVIFCSQQQLHESNTDVEVGTVVGGVIGLLTGYGIRSAHWQEVPADRIGVTIEPTGGGLGLGVTLRF